MSRTVLVSFIGKGQRANENQPRSHTGYRTTWYDFTPLGGEPCESALFGLALLKYLHSQGQHPERWIVLGSPQSNWDALLEAIDSNKWHEIESLYQQVEKAVREEEKQPSRHGSGFVTAELLAEWAKALSEYLPSTRVMCHLIGWSYDEAEQQRLWEILYSETQQGDHLILDITHGFRHQPALTAFMVMLLNRLRNLSGVQFYYGARDMTTQGKTPVLKIDFISDLVHATEAVATYQETGDYEPLAEFALQQEALEQTRRLIFEQRVNKPHFNALQPAASAIQRLQEVDPLRRSLIPLVQRELEVLRQQRDLHARLAIQADKAIKHRNYMVAVPLLWEAILSLACFLTESGEPENYQARENAEQSLIEQPNQYLTDEERSVLRSFREVRNAIVHGTRRSERTLVKSALEDDNGMRSLYDQARDIYERLKGFYQRQQEAAR
ncbi:CRISPR-associated protein, TM1812 family [Armatimonadetes bacterium GBS]|jgi:CRISPR-associated Csx2 family protein|nr:CRISPR-associated protein, TM1812 family [Armatimonadetes bacterium GBS]CUU38811.1 CRISPR-associated protein, TM1812 family [Armatimonadetes bacterium GXS]